MIKCQSEFLNLYEGALPVEDILTTTYLDLKNKNFGAIINFIGVIRDENDIDGLSFDLYKPILEKWFNKWIKEAKKQQAIIKMFHSIGNVFISETSFIAIISSPKRRVSLELIDKFVEDFKAQAPIWKYDIINGERVYAKDRSQKIQYSGLLV